MKFEIAKWFNNHQSPVVLFIDDLSDAYVNVYKENYKNDWGYLCDQEESAFSVFQRDFLNKYPNIRITFFVPYLAHAWLEESASIPVKKHSIGDRNEFTNFLKYLQKQGHEIAHHGSNHGQYTESDQSKKWIQEWLLYKDNYKKGIEITKHGKKVFKEFCDIDIYGGKFCGYAQAKNSLDIINNSNFLYWCDQVSYETKNYDIKKYKQTYLMPTTFPGNAFVKLAYLTNNPNKDRIKKLTKIGQPFYNYLMYKNLDFLYKNRHVISIQEHYSPSTTRGTVLSANIVSDLLSLTKIFDFLEKKSIWYATTKDIINYHHVREETSISLIGNKITLTFNEQKNRSGDKYISIINKKPFKIKNEESHFNNGFYVINLKIKVGINEYIID